MKKFTFRVSEISNIATDIKRFRLKPISGLLPIFSGGSHVVVTMEHSDRQISNPYSLMGPPSDGSAYEISVLKTVNSRGGSHFMHQNVTVGTELTIGHPVNLFPIDRTAHNNLLVAGGIGITPFIAMMEQLALMGAPFRLHYAMRDKTRGAYAEDLKAEYDDRVCLYRSSEGERIPVDILLQSQPLGTHLYVCGPERMIDSVLETARRQGWAEENLHVERFLAPPSGKPFTLRLARSGLTIEVGEYQSVLEAVEAAGVDAAYLCRGGACGECETRVLECDGELVHNDHYLTPDERAAKSKIMICVSRIKGRELVVDL